MTIESTVSRASKEVENGRLWRAKEILGSSISTYGYSQEIFHAQADVLIKMGDDLEAGKFYLLSIDSPCESEIQAIELFLFRFVDNNYKQLLMKFPRSSRLRNRDNYPDHLREHLVGMGAPAVLTESDVSPKIGRSSSNGRLFQIGCSIIALCTIVCVFVGISEILSWIW